jgi:hypothetical protein
MTTVNQMKDALAEGAAKGMGGCRIGCGVPSAPTLWFAATARTSR